MTDELRRLLDERGVEWSAINDTSTTWLMPVGNQVVDGFRIPVWYDGTLHVECVMSPTKAVETTLGRGKCKTVSMDCFGNPPYNMSGLSGNSTAVGCSECGAPWSTCGLFRGNQLKHNFKACPICGREVEK